jgi:4-carboxymuconolactone decarboxylase
MARLSPIKAEQLSAAQKEIYDAIISGPRGKFGGPFPALLHNPEIANRVQALGETLRFNGKLSPALREIAILVTAHTWKNVVEWDAHVVIALREGVSEALIEAIMHNAIPEEINQQELLILSFCRALNQTRFVDENLYQKTLKTFGIEVVVELVVMLGYFSTLAMLLNTFEVAADPVDGVPPEHLKM